MDSKALYSLSYGVFVLGSKDGAGETGGKINACITNTCFQAAVGPTRLAISCINQNLTCQMIKNSGVFSLSVLDSTCTFDTIFHFGYQSGREVEKFADFDHELDSNGCPFVTKQVCAVFECKVLSSEDLGSHTLFIAEVTDSRVVSSNPPLTYADYQARIKPKKTDSGTTGPAAADASEPAKKVIGWRCKICGYEYEGAQLPQNYECPICGHPAEDFEPIYEA